MITLLSPAKSMDYSPAEFDVATSPRMLNESMKLVKTMQRKSARNLKELMSISDKLAAQNKERFAQFEEEHNSKNAKQAILTFNGEVYWGLEAGTMSASDLNWSQDHVRILSGLYGVLRPFDLIQPYRLEMGTKLKTRRGKDLYAYWGDRLTKQLNVDIAETGAKYLFNLASKEYYKALDPKRLSVPVYAANFLELRDGEYKFISFTAKRARGWLTRYIIDNRLENPEDAKSFNSEGYAYIEDLSSPNEFVFVR